MANNKIAYQGILGSNSYIACQQWYQNYQPIGCYSFDEAFDLVEQGEVDLAMIPIENTHGGRVAEIHTTLSQTSCWIIAEHFLPVKYALCALPQSSLSQLTTVISHPQALAQCRNRIKQLGLRRESYSDTAGAAKLVAQRNDPELAAIAPIKAVDIYQLQVLQSDFEDHSNNVTRFIVITGDQSKGKTNLYRSSNQQNFITSIFFACRSIPAALYKCLGGFATNNINLIKLESYISISDFEQARFYIEIEGSSEQPNVRLALEELKMFTKDCRIIGCYPAEKYRTSKITQS